jgi:hypothetical protein
MLRIHRRNLSPSKRFRLKLVLMVVAAVTPDGSLDHPHNVCIWLACFLTVRF